MANAGNHNDTRLLKAMIKQGKLIKISPNDHIVNAIIKARFNDVVLNDHVRNSKSFNGRKTIYHTAWERMDKTLIWANQYRFKYFYFETITGDLYRPA